MVHIENLGFLVGILIADSYPQAVVAAVEVDQRLLDHRAKALERRLRLGHRIVTAHQLERKLPATLAKSTADAPGPGVVGADADSHDLIARGG